MNPPQGKKGPPRRSLIEAEVKEMFNKVLSPFKDSEKPKRKFNREVGRPAVRKSTILRAFQLFDKEEGGTSEEGTSSSKSNNVVASTPHYSKRCPQFLKNCSVVLSPIVQGDDDKNTDNDEQENEVKMKSEKKSTSNVTSPKHLSGAGEIDSDGEFEGDSEVTLTNQKRTNVKKAKTKIPVRTRRQKRRTPSCSSSAEFQEECKAGFSKRGIKTRSNRFNASKVITISSDDDTYVPINISKMHSNRNSYKDRDKGEAEVREIFTRSKKEAENVEKQIVSPGKNIASSQKTVEIHTTHAESEHFVQDVVQAETQESIIRTRSSDKKVSETPIRSTTRNNQDVHTIATRSRKVETERSKIDSVADNIVTKSQTLAKENGNSESTIDKTRKPVKKSKKRQVKDTTTNAEEVPEPSTKSNTNQDVEVPTKLPECLQTHCDAGTSPIAVLSENRTSIVTNKSILKTPGDQVNNIAERLARLTAHKEVQTSLNKNTNQQKAPDKKNNLCSISTQTIAAESTINERRKNAPPTPEMLHVNDNPCEPSSWGSSEANTSVLCSKFDAKSLGLFRSVEDEDFEFPPNFSNSQCEVFDTSDDGRWRLEGDDLPIVENVLKFSFIRSENNIQESMRESHNYNGYIDQSDSEDEPTLTEPIRTKTQTGKKRAVRFKDAQDVKRKEDRESMANGKIAAFLNSLELTPRLDVDKASYLSPKTYRFRNRRRIEDSVKLAKIKRQKMQEAVDSSVDSEESDDVFDEGRLKAAEKQPDGQKNLETVIRESPRRKTNPVTVTPSSPLVRTANRSRSPPVRKQNTTLSAPSPQANRRHTPVSLLSPHAHNQERVLLSHTRQNVDRVTTRNTSKSPQVRTQETSLSALSPQTRSQKRQNVDRVTTRNTSKSPQVRTQETSLSALSPQTRSQKRQDVDRVTTRNTSKSPEVRTQDTSPSAPSPQAHKRNKSLSPHTRSQKRQNVDSALRTRADSSDNAIGKRTRKKLVFNESSDDESPIPSSYRGMMPIVQRSSAVSDVPGVQQAAKVAEASLTSSVQQSSKVSEPSHVQQSANVAEAPALSDGTEEVFKVPTVLKRVSKTKTKANRGRNAEGSDKENCPCPEEKASDEGVLLDVEPASHSKTRSGVVDPVSSASVVSLVKSTKKKPVGGKKSDARTVTPKVRPKRQTRQRNVYREQLCFVPKTAFEKQMFGDSKVVELMMCFSARDKAAKKYGRGRQESIYLLNTEACIQQSTISSSTSDVDTRKSKRKMTHLGETLDEGQNKPRKPTISSSTKNVNTRQPKRKMTQEANEAHAASTLGEPETQCDEILDVVPDESQKKPLARQCKTTISSSTKQVNTRQSKRKMTQTQPANETNSVCTLGETETQCDEILDVIPKKIQKKPQSRAPKKGIAKAKKVEDVPSTSDVDTIGNARDEARWNDDATGSNLKLVVNLTQNDFKVPPFDNSDSQEIAPASTFKVLDVRELRVEKDSGFDTYNSNSLVPGCSHRKDFDTIRKAVRSPARGTISTVSRGTENNENCGSSTFRNPIEEIDIRRLTGEDWMKGDIRSSLLKNPLPSDDVTFNCKGKVVSLKWVINPSNEKYRTIEKCDLLQGLSASDNSSASGFLKIPVGAKKPLVVSNIYCYYFTVLEGEGLVILLNRTCVVQMSDNFYIPAGLPYSVENLGEVPLFLNYVRIRSNE